MRVTFLRAALAAAIVVTGGALAVGVPAGAVPRCVSGDICVPEPPEPTSPPTGMFTSFRAWAQACEPRLTPWNTIQYQAPGSYRTVISVLAWPNVDYTDLRSYSVSNNVTFVHQSHGTYRVLAYNSANQVVDSRYWITC